MKRLLLLVAAPFFVVGSGYVRGDDAARKPYCGKPWPIPGVIEAENFDDGPEGAAFHDIDNTGLKDPKPTDKARMAGRKYRFSTVNIEKADYKNPADTGTFIVGSIKEGEWLAYTVDVERAGKYDLEVSIAGWGKTRGTVRFEFDGKDVTGEIEAPDTKKWDKFTTVTKPGVELTQGVHTMRVVISKGDEVLNLDNFKFTPAGTPAPPQK